EPVADALADPLAGWLIFLPGMARISRAGLRLASRTDQETTARKPPRHCALADAPADAPPNGKIPQGGSGTTA
ncbi:MAG TPA: hypothetical protein PLL33_13030, partial [Paracoccus sp. (in: a-proteobacteria)]|nr:hypothetical protein [Paracoccus sp. (in: a-proteobacteria)]